MTRTKPSSLNYHIDFGADVARYIDAFFANVQWDDVERRLDQARTMSVTLRGSAP